MKSKLPNLGFSLARAETSPTNGWKAALGRNATNNNPPKLELLFLERSCIRISHEGQLVSMRQFKLFGRCTGTFLLFAF